MAIPAIQVRLGKRVRALRTAKGHSQETFAGLANIDRSAYGKLERGETCAGLISLARIALALEIELSELLRTVEIDLEEIKAIPRSARGPKPIGKRG
jgi:transcriptional regulator with XRE-family HTH domain